MSIETRGFNERRDLTKIDKVMEALPEVQAGKNLWQNNFHEFDVYGHTVEFVNHMKKILSKEGQNIDPNLIAAGWLHDIGKPVVAKPKEKDGIVEQREQGKPYHDFTDHEIVGEKMVMSMDAKVFEQLGLDQKRIAALVYCHYLPMKGVKETRKTKNWQEFKQKYCDLNRTLNSMSESKDRSPITKGDIMLMFLADKLAQGDPDKYCTDQGELFAIRDALLKIDDQEEQELKEVYEIQKRAASNSKQYAVKE